MNQADHRGRQDQCRYRAQGVVGQTKKRFSRRPAGSVGQNDTNEKNHGGDQRKVKNAGKRDDPASERLEKGFKARGFQERCHTARDRQGIAPAQSRQRHIEQHAEDIRDRQLLRKERREHPQREHQQPNQSIAKIGRDEKPEIGRPSQAR